MSAIKIPSKKIYDNKQTLVKNVINTVDYSYIQQSKETDYDAIAYSTTLDLTKDLYNPIYPSQIINWRENVTHEEDAEKSGEDIFTGIYWFRISADVYDLKNYPIRIYKSSDNNTKEVTKMYQENTGYTLKARKTRYVQSYEDYSSGLNNWEKKQEELVDEIPNSYGNGIAGVDFDNIDVVTPSISSNDNYFYAYFTKRIASDVIKTTESRMIGSLGEDVVVYTVEREVYEPLELSISFYGDITTIKFGEENGTITVGDETDANYSFSANNFLDKSITINGEDVATVVARDIATEFKDGKETYELLCSIGEYYNTIGELAVSTKRKVGEKNKMLFDIGDKVIPYKPTAAGDKEISTWLGNVYPKIFKVVGVTPIFDGAVWQRLDLLETKIVEIVCETKEIAIDGHTMISVNPTIFYSNNAVDGYNIPSGAKEVFCNGVEIGVGNGTGRSYLIEKAYYDEKNGYEIYAELNDDMSRLLVAIRSFTTDITQSGSGLISTWHGTTPAVEPQTLSFELHMS